MSAYRVLCLINGKARMTKLNNLTFKHVNYYLTGDNKIKTLYTGTVGVLLLMKINMTLKMTQSVIHV